MKVIKNYLYNMSYQILVLLVPLITVPYVARVIGAAGVGVNDYTYAVITIFVLFGQIGVLTYGNREVAYNRDDKAVRSKVFWEIEILQTITLLIAYCLFLIFIQFIGDSSKIFYLLQSIMILAGIFDISWYFMGMEDFKKTVVRNTAVKLITTVLTFVIVRSPDDVWKYILLLVLSQLIGNLTFWPYLIKEVNFVKISDLSVFRHLLPTFLLFIPTISIQIYLLLNRIMLGIIDPSGNIAVGIFSQSDKIIKLVLAIVTATGTVMLPHIAHKFINGDIDGIKDSLYKSFDFVTAISVPIMFGIIGIANEFAPWFLGEEFKKSGLIMIIEAPIILLIAWSNVTGKQFLMPVNRVKEYTVSVSIGAVCNVVCNLFMIYLWGVVGAAVATVISELLVTGIQFKYVKDDINLKSLLKNVWRYFLPAIIMCLFAHLISFNFGISVLSLMVIIVTSALIYLVGLFLTKAPIIMQAKGLLNRK